MAARSTKKNTATKQTALSGKRLNSVLLTLTLVPFIIGIILIGAWLLDLSLLEPMNTQITVGIFFLLGSFALSNAIQQKWLPAAGWTLLCLSDWLILSLLQAAVGLVIGALGLILVGIEFYKRWKAGPTSMAGKP